MQLLACSPRWEEGYAFHDYAFPLEFSALFQVQQHTTLVHFPSCSKSVTSPCPLLSQHLFILSLSLSCLECQIE